MKFALLGADDEALALVGALLDRGHRLAAVYETQQYWDELVELAPQATRHERWESLLHGTVADVVIVGRNRRDHERADQLRKLVQAAVPLWLVHPACDALVGFELDMIRRDTDGLVLPYIPETLHPAVGRLAALANVSSAHSPPEDPSQLAEAAQLGIVEQLVMERAMPRRDRHQVLDQFARDVSLIRILVGDIDKVGAMGGAGPEPSYANLSVHMSGPAGVLVRWSVGPVEEQSVAKLVLLGSRGKATLSMPENVRQWKLEIVGDQPSAESFAHWDPPAAALQCLLTVLGQQPEKPTGHPGAAQPPDSLKPPAEMPKYPDWLQACRDIEIAETIERSLRRGRTIELHHEEHTEEGTFKGIMAIGGCGLLLFSLGIMLLAALVEGLQLPLRQHPLWRLWPLFLLLPFALFLLLQLLQLLGKPQSSDSSGQADGPP